MEKRAHAGCTWIVDQLIAIRELEEKMIAAFQGADQRCSMQLRFRLAELNRWIDKLDRAVEAYSPVQADGPGSQVDRRPVSKVEHRSRQFERCSRGFAAAAHH